MIFGMKLASFYSFQINRKTKILTEYSAINIYQKAELTFPVVLNLF